MGFRVFLGCVLCVLRVMRYGVLILGDEVIVPVEASAFCGGEAMDGEVQPFLFVFLLVANWQAPLSGSTPCSLKTGGLMIGCCMLAIGSIVCQVRKVKVS